MPIYNRDGTIYALSKPNPLMQNQDFWKNYVLHNDFQPEPEIVIDKTIKIKSAPPKSTRETFLKDLEQTKPILNKILVHCLPATEKSKTNELYQETRSTLVYGEPFDFEAVKVSQGDLAIQLWTTIDIPMKSVIFPKNENYRWWRVSERTEKDGGWILSAIISDYSPYFA